jgi:hypothetical protein
MPEALRMITAMTVILGGLLSAAAASAALGYAVRKDAATKTFDVQPRTGGSGANSWPEHWPEEWLEKHGELSIDGAWFTHSSEYHVKEFLNRVGDHLGSNDRDVKMLQKRGIGTLFPFRIVGDVMHYDQESADTRLKKEAADLQTELSAIAVKRQKARKRYMDAAANAQRVRTELIALADSEDSSDPDPVKAAKDSYTTVKRALAAEEKAIKEKYSAAAASYNIKAEKARQTYPDRFWLRNVHIVALGSVGGVNAGTSHSAGVTGKIEVKGGKVSDTENGYVDIELEWTETHRILKAQHWSSTMRVHVDGSIEQTAEKLAQRFHNFGGQPTALKLDADGAWRRQAALDAHAQHGAFADIPNVQPRIQVGHTSPPISVQVLSTPPGVKVRAFAPPLVTDAPRSTKTGTTSRNASSSQPGRVQSTKSGSRRGSSKDATHRDSSRGGVPHQFISAALALGTNQASTLSIQETKGGVQFSLTTKARSSKDPQLVRLGLDEYAVNNAQHMTKKQQDLLTTQLRHQHKKVTFRN